MTNEFRPDSNSPVGSVVKPVAYLGFQNGGGGGEGANVHWPPVFAQRGGGKPSFPIFFAMSNKNLVGKMWGRGRFGQGVSPVNTPLRETIQYSLNTEELAYCLFRECFYFQNKAK